VIGLGLVAWRRWEATHDRRFLATDGLAAIAAAHVVRVRPDAWPALALAMPGLPPDPEVRRWDADLRLLEAKLALERWREVESDLRTLDLLAGGAAAPPACYAARLDAIRAEARAHTR
jgi:hypothetical protein